MWKAPKDSGVTDYRLPVQVHYIYKAGALYPQRDSPSRRQAWAVCSAKAPAAFEQFSTFQEARQTNTACLFPLSFSTPTLVPL